MTNFLLKSIVSGTIVFLLSGCSNNEPKPTVQKNVSISVDELNKMSDEQLIAHLDKNWYDFRNVTNPSEKVTLSVLSKHGILMPYVKNPSEEVMAAAVKNFPYAFEHIKNPPLSIQKMAIKSEIYLMRYIKNPSFEIQEYALKLNPKSIPYYKHMDPRLQKIAVEINPNLAAFIDNPTEETIIKALKHDGGNYWKIPNLTLKHRLLAFNSSEETIMFPDCELSDKNLTIKANGEQIKFINKTNKFISINQFAIHFEDDIHFFEKDNYNQIIIQIPPQGIVKKPMPKNKGNVIVKDINQTFSFGFSTAYRISGDDKEFNLYEKRNYKVKDNIK